MQKPLWFFLILALSLISYDSQSQNNSNESEIVEFNSALERKDFTNASLHAFKIGKSYYEMHQFSDAAEYLIKSVNLSKKISSPRQTLLSTHLLGACYYESGQYSRALDKLEESTRLAKKLNDIPLLVEGLIITGKAHGAEKHYKKGIPPLENALGLALQRDDNAAQRTCYALLSQFHQETGNSQKAAEYKGLNATLEKLEETEKAAMEKVKALETTLQQDKEEAASRISLQNQKLKEAEKKLVSKEETLLETSQSLRAVEESVKDLEALNLQRQTEINLLNKENELSLLRINEQKSALAHEAMIRNFVMLIAILVASLVVVVVFNYRKKVNINRVLDAQNKNIRSSINYAKRIQEAMLPKKELQHTYLPESFILFKPRDVVSGDFYWLAPLNKFKNEKSDLAFAALDCTGHGVPGAFMSMVGINSLNGIINRGLTHTDEILNALHTEIKNALQQDVTGNDDGMDAAVCIYRTDHSRLEFSGAKNPLVYIRNNELHQIKGDIHSIGGSKSKKDPGFRRHEIIIDQPTMVYLFSDGYRDQFGGPENKKFLSKRFTQLLLEIHQLPLNEQHDRLVQIFEQWKGSRDQTDDVLVIGVRLTPAGQTT